MLARLVASFLLLFTTSSDVLSSKFSGDWETLWIFKVARWTRDWFTKINKSPTVSNGVGASSFEIWTANSAQLLTLGTLRNSQSFIFGDWNWKCCYVGYPVGTLRPDIQMQTFLIWYFLCFHFWVKKPQKLLDIKNNICKLGKIQSELKFIWCLLLMLKVVYWDIWPSYFPLDGIS